MKLPHAALACGLCALSAAVPAIGATYTFDAVIEFSGASAPSGPDPWLRATFEDVLGGVELTMTSLLNSSSEYVNLWNFNLDPASDPDELSFSYLAGGPQPSSINTGINAFMADGDGRFDVQFDFPNSPPSDRFGGADEVAYLITSTESISAASFVFDSFPGGGAGIYLMSAHVQGIGPSGADSGWVSTPEPGSIVLLALAGAGVLKRRRSRPI